MTESLNAKAGINRQYMKERVFGLSVACPFDQGNPCDCPLHEIRKKSIEERYQWFRGLSDERILEILTYHKKCLGEKENSAVNSAGDTNSTLKSEQYRRAN